MSRHYCIPPRRLLDEFTSYELSEQLAFEELEPLPDHYWIGAMLATVVANLLGTKKHKLDDFLPHIAHAQSGDEQLALLKTILRPLPAT